MQCSQVDGYQPSEDGGNRFLGKVVTYIPNYTVSHLIYLMLCSQVDGYHPSEDGGNRFLGKVVTYIPNYTVSHFIR